jgi:hypothetical protein
MKETTKKTTKKITKRTEKILLKILRKKSRNSDLENLKIDQKFGYLCEKATSPDDDING